MFFIPTRFLLYLLCTLFLCANYVLIYNFCVSVLSKSNVFFMVALLVLFVWKVVVDVIDFAKKDNREEKSLKK